jgi:hypothetical protein
MRGGAISPSFMCLSSANPLVLSGDKRRGEDFSRRRGLANNSKLRKPATQRVECAVKLAGQSLCNSLA